MVAPTITALSPNAMTNSPFKTADHAGNRSIAGVGGAVAHLPFDPPSQLAHSQAVEPPIGGVAYTIDAFNRTIIPRAYLPDNGAIGISSAVSVPSLDTLFLGTEGGGIWTVNTTSLVGGTRITTPDGINSMAFDNSTGELWAVGDSNTLAVVRVSDGAVVYSTTSLPNGPVAVAYDSTSRQVFVATRYDPTLSAFNSTTFQESMPSINLSFTPSSLFYDPIGNRLLVGDMYGDAIRIFNPSTENIESGFWPVGAYPSAMTLDPAHDWLYVANMGSSNVSVINLTADKLANLGIPTGPGPSGLTYDPSAREILVVGGGGGLPTNITEIPALGIGSSRSNSSIPCFFCGGPITYDTASGLAFLPQGSPGGVPSTYLAVIAPGRPNPIRSDIQLTYSFSASAFDPSNGIIYLVNPTGANGSGSPGRAPSYAPGNSSIMAINGSNHRLLSLSYPVGYGASAIAYDPANQDLYVANQGDGTVSVVSTDTGLVSTISLGPSNMWNRTAPDYVAIDSHRNLVYVADGGVSNISIINGTTQTVVATLPVGSYPLAVLVDNIDNRVYVANCGSDNLTVFNETNDHLLNSLGVGTCPDALAIGTGGLDLYVANQFGPGGFSNVTVLDTRTGLPVASIPTGGDADALSYDPSNGYLYVANGGANDVAVINSTTLTMVGSGIPVTVGNGETYPTDVSFDSNTAEVFVPAAFTSAIFVIGNIPSLDSLTISPSPTEVGVPFEIAAVVANGTLPYRFDFLGLPPGCTSEVSAVIWCIPRQAGEFNLTVSVTDARGYALSRTADERVMPEIYLAPATASPAILPEGQELSVTVNVSGGVEPYTIQYAGLPPGCPSRNSSELICFPNSSGEFVITVTVADALGVERTSVSAAAVVPGLQLFAVWAGSSTIVLGASASLVSEATGGLPSYNYIYSGLPSGCATNDTPILTCTPDVTGRFKVTVTVRDELNYIAVAIAYLMVESAAQPPSPTIVAFFSNPAVIWLGNSTTLWTLLSPTSDIVSYRYTGLPTGCGSSNTSRLGCTPRESGTFSVTVSVSIEGTGLAESTTNISVVAPESSTHSPAPAYGGTFTALDLALAITASGLGGAVGALVVLRLRDGRRGEL